MTHSKQVPNMVGSKIIGRARDMITQGELVRATATWKEAKFGAVMSGSLQLSHTDSKGNGEVEKGVTSQDVILQHPGTSVWMIGAIRKLHSRWASGKRIGAWGVLLTSGNWTTRPSRMPIHYPTLMIPLIICRDPNGFPHLTWSLGTGRFERDEERKPLTSFTIGPLGFYKCDRMPFRLTNTPSSFQQLVGTCLRALNLKWCIIYLDDIVIFSKDPASHLERLEAMFQKLEQAGLKLKPSKCELFQWQITYLGHIVSAQGIATNKVR